MKTLVKNSSIYEILTQPSLKKDLLLFDKICYEEEMYSFIHRMGADKAEPFKRNVAEIDYLVDNGLIEIITREDLFASVDKLNLLSNSESELLLNLIKKIVELEPEVYTLKPYLDNINNKPNKEQLASGLYDVTVGAYKARALALIYSKVNNANYACIYNQGYQATYTNNITKKEDVLKFLLDKIPIPDLETPWEAILEYKSDEDAKRKYYVEKADIALYKKVDEILWNDWDPIGVNGNTDDDPRDEYYGYLPMVFRLVKANVSEGEIAAHLYGKETGHMGLDGSIERCRRVAAKLLEAARNDGRN